MEKTCKILLLEDAVTDAELIERQLRKSNLKHTFLHVKDGMAFREALADLQPDLVLSDYALQRQFNGLDALKLVREEKRYIPFIIVTGSLDEETAADCIIAGADAYVIKEHLARLISAVRNALEKGASRNAVLQSRERLRAEEEKYHSLFTSIRDAILVADVNRGIIDCNPAFTEIFGYELEDIKGKVTKYIYASDDEYQKMGQRLSQNLKNPNFIHTVTYRKKDGTTFAGETNIFGWKDNQGNINGLIGLIRDITERIVAEKNLRQSEQRYRSVTETAYDAIVSINSKEEIIAWNRGATRMFQYSSKEILGQSVVNIIPPRYRKPHIKGFKHLLSSGKPTLIGKPTELYGLRKDGTEFPLEFTLSQWTVDNDQYITSIIRDTTRRKKQIQTIQKHAQKIDAINLAAHTLAQELDLGTVLKICLGIAREMFKADAVTIFQLDENHKHLSVLDSTRPYSEKIKNFRIKLGQGLTGTVVQSGKAQFVNRINETNIGVFVPGTKNKPESLMSVPLIVKKDVIGAISLSKLGNAEFNLDDLNLLQNIADLSAMAIHNARLYEASQKSDQMKTFFLANISHEIRTPMNSILGFSSLLRNELKDQVGKKFAEYFDVIEHSGQRLIKTVHEILDISQLDTSTYNPSMEELDLKLLVKQVVRELTPAALGKGLKLDYRSMVALPLIIADRYSITQAISNVLENAVKYTQEGNITVRIEGDNDVIRLTVKDTGIGMSKKFQEQAFEIFSQESTGYTRKYEGLGLGLALTKRYLELNGAGINLDSRKKAGTRITITFPVSRRSS